MSNQSRSLIGLLILQAVAVIIYPPAFFQTSPQAEVLPPTLFLLFAVALVAMNTGTLSPVAGRTSLVFVQGVNIVVRLMMFLPNLRLANGNWDWALLVIQIIGIALSWFTITQMEKRPLGSLLLRTKAKA